MKVTASNEFKRFLTAKELSAVGEIIKYLRDNDEAEIESYARMAINSFGYNTAFEIYRPTAVVAKNKRANDVFFEGSKDLDVWIEFLAFDAYCGAFDCGVYLSDLWGLTEENKSDLHKNMYCEVFTKENRA